MNVKEIREKSAEDQETSLRDLLKEQFSLRMQNASGELSDNSQLKKVRRNIARLKTVMNEKKAGE